MQISGYIGELWAHFLDVWSLDGESDFKTMTGNEICIDFQNSYLISMHKFYYLYYFFFKKYLLKRFLICSKVLMNFYFIKKIYDY